MNRRRYFKVVCYGDRLQGHEAVRRRAHVSEHRVSTWVESSRAAAVRRAGALGRGAYVVEWDAGELRVVVA